VGVHIGDLHQKGFPSIQPSLHLITIPQTRITTFSNGLLLWLLYTQKAYPFESGGHKLLSGKPW
jgi:hypothetical protein